MSHEAARQLITSTVKDVLDASSLATKSLVEWPLLPFTRPTNPPWHKFNLIPGDTEPAALGDRMERTPFVVTIQTFFPDESTGGTKPVWDLADVLRSMNYAVARSPDGKTVVNFRTWGSPQEFPAQNGLTPFNVTVRGHFDTYP